MLQVYLYKLKAIQGGCNSMDIVKNSITSIFAALIETAPKLDATTRSRPLHGETDYPEEADYED